MTRTITTEVFAFSTPYAPVRLDDLASDEIARKLCYTTHDMSTSGYVLVGRGTVTIELEDSDDIVSAQVAILRKQRDQIRADAQGKVNQLEEQIQNLQALNYESANDEIAA